MSPSLEVCQMNWSAKLVFALASLDVLPPCLSPARITSSPGIPMEFMKVLPLEATGGPVGPVGPVGPGSVQYVEVA